MPTPLSPSRALLSLAEWIAPPNRRALCQAMRAELDAMDEGHLSWALGGLTSAAGWRMRVDGLFWVVVLACAFPVWSQVTFLAEIPIYHLLDRFGSPAIYGYWLLQEALLCALLAAWRPRLGAVAALAYLLMREVIETITWIYVLRWPMTKDFHIMDASPIVGFSAVLCWCLVGAWIGATVRRSLTPRPSPAAPA